MINYVAANHDPCAISRHRANSMLPARLTGTLLSVQGRTNASACNLARLEMKILFETLLDRVAAVEPAGEASAPAAPLSAGLENPAASHNLGLKIRPESETQRSVHIFRSIRKSAIVFC